MLYVYKLIHIIQPQICRTFYAGTATFWHDLRLSA